MATTSKKSASKKTKTTRKVAATSTRKTTAKKPTNKRATTKVTSSVKDKSKNANTGSAVVSAKAVKVVPTAKSAAASSMNMLRQMNLIVGGLFAAMAGLILWLSKPFAGIHEVTTAYPTKDALASASGQSAIVTGTHHIVDLHLSWMIAAFMIVSAVSYLSLATWLRARYEREVGARVNRMRWITFAVSGSILMMTIAMLAGITDLATHLSIVGFTVVASLVGLSREHHTQNGERTRLIYGIGGLAAAGPWVLIAVYAFGAHQYGAGGTPTFVYWIYATGLVMYIALAKNLLLQTQGRGRWADYTYAERAYVGLSLVGKAAIAAQIYAAVLKK